MKWTQPALAQVEAIVTELSADLQAETPTSEPTDTSLQQQRLTPALNQVTIGQAYQSYEVYQKLEPSARKIWQAWNWAQWLLNPAAAVAKTDTQRTSSRATQKLLSNLSQLMREAALRNLGRQAIALYSGSANPGL